MTGSGAPLPGDLSDDMMAPGPLSSRGGILRTRTKIHTTRDKITLSQKTHLWFRAAVCLWAIAVLLTPFMIYSELFTSQTTHFTCDRTTGTCAVDGNDKDIPRVGDIARAEMDHDSNRRDGPNWGINLVTRDGKKHAIEQQRAIADSAIADYRATVRAINAYLGDGTRQRLDTSFTYRASLGEKLQSIFYLFFGIVTLMACWSAWTSRSYTVEQDKVTALVRRPFVRIRGEVVANRISAIRTRPYNDGRAVELEFDDGSKITVLQADAGKVLDAERIAKELADYLVKPLRSVTA